jgi:hypothetical protein
MSTTVGIPRSTVEAVDTREEASSMQHADRPRNAPPTNAEAPPSEASTLFVAALIVAVVIVAGLIFWASMANPGMPPFSP